MKNFQENAAMTANETANVNVTENTKNTKLNGKKNSAQKRQANPALWRILNRAKHTFNAQLHKDNTMKLKCIEMYMAVETNDAPKFWGEFMKYVDRLLDSRRYVNECQMLGYDPENVAEHIVFLGSATVNKVLLNGVLNTLGNDLKLYKDRLSSEEADIYRNDIIAFLQNEQVA